MDKQLVETNKMVSFHEMHKFFYEFQFCGIFYMLGSKENCYQFYSSIKGTLVLTFVIINVQIYRATLQYTPYY
jgi:hypothetical protein